ncbi:unnamed protein product [Symbiodinium sp. CCMP2592]|nr:unnamed protein product [Symbiodinium sp. CCMP2592]
MMTSLQSLLGFHFKAVFKLTPFGYGFADTCSSTSFHLDCVGGKTIDSAAVDILDSWTSLQFQQPEDNHSLREPQPLRTLMATQRRLQLAGITAGESDDDGFFAEIEVSSDSESDYTDGDRLVIDNCCLDGFSSGDEVLCDNDSDTDGSESSRSWDPAFHDQLAENLTWQSDVVCADASYIVADMDRCGGSSEGIEDDTCGSETRASAISVFLPVEVMRHLPSFYFDHAYLHALATVSSWTLNMVRDKKNWQGLVVDIDQPDLQLPARLRSMMDLLSLARWVCVNIEQLSMLLIIPASCRLNWTPVSIPRPPQHPFLMFDFRSRKPLLGVADFDIVLPAELKGLMIGVREWRGNVRFYCRIDNVFHRSITWSLGLNDNSPTPYGRASRFAPLPDQSNRFQIRWNKTFFAIALNNEGVLRARVTESDEGLPVEHLQDDHDTASTAVLRPCTELASHNSCDLDTHLHIDLYKKTISADGIMERKPYGYTTRMFHRDGFDSSEWRREQVSSWREALGSSCKTYETTEVGAVVPFCQGADASDNMDVDEITEEGTFAWQKNAKTPIFQVPDDHDTASTAVLRPCTELASHNSCDLDTHLQFEAEGHTYFYKGVKVGCSVTTLIHQYSEDFDPLLALSKMKNGTRWPRSEYLDAEMNFSSIAGMLKGLDFRYQADLVALLQEDKPDVDEICRLFCISRSELKDLDKVIEQFVLHDNEIILLWETKKNCASNSGTWMHAMLEHLFNGYQIMAGKMQGELNAAVRIVSQMENAVVYRTEWCIYAPEEDVAGSIDMVLKDVNNDVLYLLDWKRSEKLEEKYNSYGKTMHAPLQGINDSQGHHYRLQLNIYKWILEKYYHVKVAGMKVVCIHPRYLPDGFVDDVPDLADEVSALMQCRRNEKLAVCVQPEPQEPAPQPQREGLVVPETETGQPSLTQPFQILPNTQASNGYRVEEDLEAMFEDMFEDEADAARMAAKKRRLLPGAAEHSDRFRSTFQRSHDILRTTLDVLVADRSVQPNTILHSTKKSLQELRMDFPNVSDQIRRLVLVAAHLTEGKISDKPMLADSAALLWMVEGDRHLRVHKGFLYIYDGDGCFQPFGGIPPEAVLHRVHDFFVYLEGILRRMKPENSRRAASVARAIVSDLQSFETEDDFLQACRDAVNRRSTTAAYPSRLDAADDEVANQAQAEAASDNTWTIDAAEKSWKLSWHIRTELMQTRMISLLVEWCETEDQRSSSVTYDDVCFVYDSPGSDSPIDVVKKSPANNCYVRIPHPLLDPVMENKLERLEKFYQQTFWCNLDVFKCFQAATAIAKRGYNVDRCFIGISPGGVGQSLYSLHLSEMYKQNHTFFDPNIWHLDEELRKQVETFARCFIMTGQEAPETSKKLHIDLYKKTISADGIMGRKPYGYTTRMFHTVGWTRLEVNRMMQFAGVKSSGFNSMFRRAFVWKSKARFIHKKFLAKYIDHEKDGIFEADPSLNKFLSTSQASIAGLRLQWAFERDYSKDDCYQLIENYCNGGDGFLTEDVMRNACGLPVRQRHQQVEEGLGNLLDGDADSNAEREDRDISWKNLRSSVIQHMLDKDLEVMTFYEFKKMPCKAGEHPNLSKQAMWDEMPKQEVVRTGIAKPKTGKERPGAIIPSFIFKKKFHEVCPQTEAGQVRMQFQEEHDLGRLRSYAYRCGGRSINDDNMKMYYTAMLPASKRGRRSLEQDELTTKYQKLIQKLEDHSEHVTSLLSSQKRRILAKTSVNEDGNAAVSSSSMSATSVEYKYSDKQNYSIHGRRYGPKGSAQSTSRRLQKYLVDGHTVDLDIHNCCLTLIHQLLQKLSPDPPLADDLAEVLDEVTHRRADFVAKLNVQISEGKDIITTVFNGGAPPGKLKDNQLIKKLQKIALYVRWVACNILHDDYMSLADNKLKSFPSATIMSLMWHAVEDSILQAWSEHVLMDNPKHLSLHFDGIRVSADKVQNSEDYIRKCQAVVKDRTSFDVKIMVKTHGSLIDLIQTRGNVANNLTNVPAKLLEAGNCIPCSLWHSDPLSRTTVAAAVLDDDKAENAEAKKTRYRTYRSVATMCGLDIVSCLGLPQPHVKTFLLHYEGNGSPHCLSVRLEGDTATLIDGNVVYKIPVGAFQEACAAAVDRSTVVSHWKRDAKDKLDDKSTLLLDLVAGATSGTSDEETDMDIDKGFGKITHDDEDENTPVISDGILQSPCQEVEDVLDKLKENSLRQGGRRHCPFCPFRSFAQLRQLRTHMTNHHTEKNQYVCSGTKQIKVILSLYDHGASSQSRVEELLQSSASLLRATIQPSLESNRNSIDKKIRLILDATGPRYVNLESIGTTIKARRVKNMYYTHSFADLLLREMVLGHAQATERITNIMLRQ